MEPAFLKLKRLLWERFRMHPRCAAGLLVGLVLLVVLCTLGWREILGNRPVTVKVEARAEAAAAISVEAVDGEHRELLKRQALVYPGRVQRWDVEIEVLGESRPGAFAAQVWLLDLDTPEEQSGWSGFSVGEGWTATDSPPSRQKQALVAYPPETPRLTATLHGSALRLRMGTLAWGGKFRITINGTSEVIDTWASEWSVQDLEWAAEPQAGDVLEDVILQVTVPARMLRADELVVSGSGGVIALTSVLVDGRNLDSRDGAMSLKQLPEDTVMAGWLGLLTSALLGAAGWLLARTWCRHGVPLGVVVVVLFKLWLVSGDEIRAGPYDDQGYMYSASQWYWGADYDASSFARQPVYPLFIALNQETGLPLRISLELLYLGACLLLASGFAKCGTMRWAIVPLFAVMALNPISLPVLSFAYQDVLYAPLLIGLTGAGLHLPGASDCRKRWSWSFVFALLFSLTWNTRQEGILIAGLAVLLAVGAALIWSEGRPPLRQALRQMGIVLLPAILLTVGITSIFKGAGLAAYGYHSSNDFRMDGFQALYKELLRIKPDEVEYKNPIPEASRLKAYAESPTLRQIQPYLEGPDLDVVLPMHGREKRDYYEMIFWGLRQSPWRLQRWESAGELNRFYQKAADELVVARKAGAYKSRGIYGTFIDPTIGTWLPELPEAFARYWSFMVRPVVRYMPQEEDAANKAIFDAMALRRGALTLENHALYPVPESPQRAAKAVVAGWFRWINWSGLVVIPVVGIWMVLEGIRRRRVTVAAVAVCIGGYVFLSRLSLFALMDAMAFGYEDRYIFPAAVVFCGLTVFCALVLVRQWMRRESLGRSDLSSRHGGRDSGIKKNSAPGLTPPG